MRIAVIQYAVRSAAAVASLSKGIARGFEAQGHQLRTFDGKTDQDIPVPMFDFVVVVSETQSFLSSKPSPGLAKFLNSSVRSSGKRSLAVLLKSCLRPAKASLGLMSAMEREGLVVIDCLAFSAKDDAEGAFKGYRAER
jgi:hypothetical protein